MRKNNSGLFLFLLFTGSALTLTAQTVVRGIVSDAQTGEPIPFVNISPPGKAYGATTDFDGQYVLMTPDSVGKLQYSSIGYKTEIRKVALISN